MTTELVDLPSLAVHLRQHVDALAHTPRVPGSASHRQALDYIRGHLDEAGFEALEVSFREAGVAGINVLTRPMPDQANLPLLIIGAHYDSVAGSPGADDNASAVAALLELASWIGPRIPALGTSATSRLQLAAYDLEEYGMVGSFVHSREIRRAGTPVRGMLSLEMLGYTSAKSGSQRLPAALAKLNPSVGNFIGVCGNDASRDLVWSVADAMKQVPGLPVEALAVPGTGEVFPEVRLSDHSSFWDHGFPALMITDTSFFRNPHYHLASDRPDTLDYEFLAKVTMGVCLAVEGLMGSS